MILYLFSFSFAVAEEVQFGLSLCPPPSFVGIYFSFRCIFHPIPVHVAMYLIVAYQMLLAPCWELVTLRRRYDKDHVVASTGVGDRCRGRATSYPGLVSQLGLRALKACPDRHMDTFAGVKVFIVSAQ